MSRMPMGDGDTLQNASIGAAISTVAYFIPVVNAIAPIFGGFVAGLIQKRGVGGGVKVGSLKGVIMVIPAILLGFIASGILAGIPIIGEILAGSIVVLVVVIVLHSVALGLVGGLFGGILAGDSS